MAGPFDDILQGGLMPGYEQTPFNLPMQTQNLAPSPSAIAPTEAPPTGPAMPQGITTALPPVQFGGGAQPEAPAQKLAYRRAMQSIESGGRCDLITDAGRGRRVIGAYQVSEDNIPEWTRRWTGRAMTTEEFRNSCEAQDAVFDGQFGEYVRQFGSPQRAAEAWLGGPGGVGRNDIPDRFGTTPVAHGRNFISALSRAGVPQQPGFTPSTVAMSPDMAAAMGDPSATNVPAPGALSPRAAAMAPGLASAAARAASAQGALQAQPNTGALGPQPTAANSPVEGALPFGDLWQGQGAQSTGLTQLASFMAQAPAAEQIAAGKIYQRGQQIRAENPSLSAQQVAQLLIRDPVFGQNATALGQKAAAIFQAAVTDPGQAQLQTVGNTLVSRDPASGAITPQFQGLPDQAQTFQWYSSQPPAVQQQIRDFIQARQMQSDKEQAWARLHAENPNVYTNELRDKWLAGLIRSEPILNEYNQIVGQRMVDTTTNRVITDSTNRTPGGSPASSVAPGAGAAGAPGVTPPASGAPASDPTRLDVSQLQTRTGPVTVRDFTGLRLQSSMIENPADIAGASGPIAAASSLLGGLLGNIPGLEMTGEGTSRRADIIRNMRANYATYQQGRELAGEHREGMATLPDALAWSRNPTNVLSQLISARERVVRDLELFQNQLANPLLSSETKKKVSDQYAKGQVVLQSMPTIAEMIEAREQVMVGNRTTLRDPNSGIGAITGATTTAASRILHGDIESPESDTLGGPPNVGALSDERLRDIYFRRGTDLATKRQIEAEARRRRIKED